MIGVAAAMALTCSCDDKGYNDMKTPGNMNKQEVPDLPEIPGMHSYKAPLYYSIYEYMREQGLAGKPADECVYTLDQWIEVLDYIKENLLPYGYDMVCTDGSGTFKAENGSPYMTSQSSLSFKEFVKAAKERGIRVGIYDNPWWIHCDDDVLIPGTNYSVGSLRYNPAVDVVNKPGQKDIWHDIAVVTHPGGREWIDGFFKHYHDLGVEMIRMDFLNWFEDGYSRLEKEWCGPGYGRAVYAQALAWCAESAKKYGIFLSLVMPNMYNDAELEAKYGNMTRIVSDAWNGTWEFTSSNYRGNHWPNWPACRNQFDGFTYWNHISGPGRVILDGDFTRLNTYADDNEKETVISLQLMAGGPIAVADRPSVIGDNVKFYQNREMLALNADRFVGRPLSDKLNTPGSNIWQGAMSDGSYIVGLFNRDDEARTVSVDLITLGLTGTFNVRDLWKHADEGVVSATISANIPAHGCKIVKLTR